MKIKIILASALALVLTFGINNSFAEGMPPPQQNGNGAEQDSGGGDDDSNATSGNKKQHPGKKGPTPLVPLVPF